MRNSILIVEDDKDLLDALSIGLIEAGYHIETACDVDNAVKLIKNQNIQLILSDVQLETSNGLELLSTINELSYQVPIIFMTAHGDVQDAVLAMQKGANDYITKPFELDKLVEKIKLLVETAPVQEDDFLNEKINHVYNLAKQVAFTNATVLLSGESGTGKEVLAQYIHYHSNRQDKPFVAINCAAIPDNMLEAMLFGYEKGAYTGAHQSNEGKFEQANGGTLLLDEISEMPLSLQAKLLRVLQEKEVERLGGKQAISLNVRIIATTNKDLMQAVSEKEFRSDLFFRLNVFPIHMPPLRERKEDILQLAKRFIEKYQQQISTSLSAKALEVLKNHEWPGNIRELENVIQRACILTNTNMIEPQHIILEDIKPQSNTIMGESELSDQLASKEHELILNVLNKYNGNRTEVAKSLGISPRTLRYKIAKMKSLGYQLP